MTSSSRVPQECEATLIIWSENPPLVARQIASLTSIATYRILPKASETIHDLYLDTRDRQLQRQRLALRVREIGARHWLTLKGPSQPTDWGGVERLEIETLWSKEILTRIIHELMDRGINIPQQYQDFDQAYPLEVMKNLKLKVVQDRKTHRQVRDVVSMGGENSSLLAELAIDSVFYHFGNQHIRHYEVEIESKVRDGSTVLRTVTESLVATYGLALRRWRHSKLAIGKAIQNMLSEGTLEELLDIDNNLKPVAYDKIDDCLKRSRCAS